MGMYTEIFFRADVDEYAFNAIQRIADDWKPEDDDHPFWDLPRRQMLTAGGSASFPDPYHFLTDQSHGSRAISFRASLKDYNSETERFFDWVGPHLKCWGFVGYTLYEEFDQPTLWIWSGTKWEDA